MSGFEHDSITPFGADKGEKKEQVATMFDQIAYRYDLMNRFLSAGIDRTWRRKAIKELTEVNPRQILDVATGTAEVALMTYALLSPKPEKITGIDISEGMLALGRQKIADRQLADQIVLQQGDSEAINFPDASFDAVTVAFGVRNFANLEKGLLEIRRVLKPNGKLVVLEFSKPQMPLVKEAYNMYTKLVAPQAGKMLAKSKAAYQYLNDSINAFPEGNAFLEILNKTGYINTYQKKLTLGICSIYCGKNQSGS